MQHTGFLRPVLDGLFYIVILRGLICEKNVLASPEKC